MSTFAVTVERLEILPHPNADNLELARVGVSQYRAVVRRGAYKTGDYALYIPEQALLPKSLIEELGLVGRLAGKEGNRVKAVYLRGELSQGIVCRPSALAGVDLEAAYRARLNFAEQLGITKWVPEIPAHMSGQTMFTPRLLSWIEIEDIKRFPNIFNPGEPVIATEKIHGTATLATYDSVSDKLLVSSKGLGAKHLSLVEDEGNLYWRALRAYDVPRKIVVLAERFGATRFGLYGETYGKGVQDLTYGISSYNKPGYAVFDALLETGDRRLRWLTQAELRALCNEIDLPMVPILYEGPYDYNLLAELAEGQTLLGGGHIREGLVVRSAVERYSEITGGRAIAKFVSKAYLTRKGEVTEFE